MNVEALELIFLSLIFKTARVYSEVQYQRGYQEPTQRRPCTDPAQVLNDTHTRRERTNDTHKVIVTNMIASENAFSFQTFDADVILRGRPCASARKLGKPCHAPPMNTVFMLPAGGCCHGIGIAAAPFGLYPSNLSFSASHRRCLSDSVSPGCCQLATAAPPNAFQWACAGGGSVFAAALVGVIPPMMTVEKKDPRCVFPGINEPRCTPLIPPLPPQVPGGSCKHSWTTAFKSLLINLRLALLAFL